MKYFKICLFLFVLFSLGNFQAMALGLSGEVHSNLYVNPNRSFTVCLPIKNAASSVNDKLVNNVYSWVDFKYPGDLKDYMPYYSIEFFKVPSRKPAAVFYNAAKNVIGNKIKGLQQNSRGISFSIEPGKIINVGNNTAYQVVVNMKANNNTTSGSSTTVYTSIYFPDELYMLTVGYDDVFVPSVTHVFPWGIYNSFLRSIKPIQAQDAQNLRRCD